MHGYNRPPLLKLMTATVRSLPAIVLGLLLGSCSPPPTPFEQILQNGELSVITRHAPTTFYTHDEEGRGIEYELASGFAQRLGVELRIEIAGSFQQIIDDVASGRVHIGAANLTVTDTRSKLVDFGPGYQRVEQAVVYRRNAPRPRAIPDLVGGQLAVLAGSIDVELLEQARIEHAGLEWVEHPGASVEELVRQVAQGEIDYTVVDSTALQLLRNAYPEVRAAFSIGQSGEMAWALPPGASELGAQVAAYFAQIAASGELQAVLDRYNVSAREFDYVESRAFARNFRTRLSRYRTLFEEAELETGISWRLLAAMAYQESHWNPRAVSPTGVRGLMMVTQHTAEIVGIADRNDPRQSILGGARYLKRVQDKIPDRIAEPDKLWLAVAAYNLGFGHLEDARIITQIQGGAPDRWDDVRARLPLLEDERWYKRVKHGYAPGSVSRVYVDNIQRYFDLLQWMTADEVTADDEPLTAAR